MPTRFVRAALFAGLLALPTRAFAQATLINGLGGPSGYGQTCLPIDDDQSTSEISLDTAFPSGLDFFGTTYHSLYLNNNGNVTFNAPLVTYTPESFPVSSEPMIAPYWADVDTRGDAHSNCQGTGGNVCSTMSDGTNSVWYTQEPNRFIATWNAVGYFDCKTDHRMSFQLILSTPPGLAAGDFDVEFRYNHCDWTTGDVSGGSDGFGGTAAQAGFDAGDNQHYYSIPGSLSMNILNVCHDSNIRDTGRWYFQIRNGQVTPCDAPGANCSPEETGADAGVDACIGYLCRGDNPLLIGGRAGPVGSCACRIRARDEVPSRGALSASLFATGATIVVARRRTRTRRVRS